MIGPVFVLPAFVLPAFVLAVGSPCFAQNVTFAKMRDVGDGKAVRQFKNDFFLRRRLSSST